MTAEHTPALAADGQGASAPRRSLILAGGGMRVAWQAGVLEALEQAGLGFDHADGTSGGTINLAMLMSGHPPAEISERWRTLRVRDFAAPLPLRDYLRGPRLPGLGGAGGIERRVFPHLGIDVEAIRAARGIEATFNLCNHATKANESIDHREIDRAALVAGISLPVLMPAVQRGGSPYLDAVWVKDANLIGAVKRGAEELWIPWCIGNTPTFRNGSFRQYVHMIEQSANGVLFEELDRIHELNRAIAAGHSPYGQRRPVVAHVIKPRHPLPLDPDFFLGRIDATTLIAMGYDDAWRYLRAADRERGVTLGPEATRMEEPGACVWWRERHRGALGEIELTAEAPDGQAFVAGPTRQARLVGRVKSPALGEAMLRDGRARLEKGALLYEASLDLGGREARLRARREAQPGGSLCERLRSLRRLHVELREREADDGALLAEGTLDPRGNGAPLPLPIVTAARSTWQQVKTAAAYERLIATELLSGRTPGS